MWLWDTALKFFGRGFSLRHQITWRTNNRKNAASRKTRTWSWYNKTIAAYDSCYTFVLYLRIHILGDVNHLMHFVTPLNPGNSIILGGINKEGIRQWFYFFFKLASIWLLYILFASAYLDHAPIVTCEYSTLVIIPLAKFTWWFNIGTALYML